MHRSVAAAVAAVAMLGSDGQSITTASSAACPTVLSPSYQKPVVGAGYTAQIVAQGLRDPRGIIFDSKGALLVVQQGVGIAHMTFNDNGGTCLVVNKQTDLLQNSNLTHGIELSADGKTLYASSSSEVFSWAYDADKVSLSGQRTLVQNMSNEDHVTRTLLLSRHQPDLLLVSRGSGENIDPLAQQLSSGVSQIRAFNLTNMTSDTVYDYPSQGMRLGWGLRNSVGVAEEPTTGRIYSVENSADQIWRDGTDIHQNNPGEEMNFHGTLAANDTEGHHGANFGYPDCFAVWETDKLPSGSNLTTGSQFAPNTTAPANDAVCAERIAPRLTFQAHMAPLDIRFTPDGSLAYISFHGSWNRNDPVGYKLSVVSFADGVPTEPANSTTAAKDILSNPDLSKCPDSCFRPVGLAIDPQGRIWMSSDATGDIYVVRPAEMTIQGGGGNSTGGGAATTSSTGAGSLVTPTGTPAPTGNAAPRTQFPGVQAWWLIGWTVALSTLSGALFTYA